MITPAILGLRSFSGDLLEGNRLVRLVYVDEAGLSLREPLVIVAAVIVDADRVLVDASRHLLELIEKWIPTHQRNGFVFHAGHLFNGTPHRCGKPFERDHPDWPDEKRWKIAADLAAIPEKFGLKLAYGFLERSAYPEPDDLVTQKIWAETPSKEKQMLTHALAFMHCAMRVDRFMREHTPDEFCMMIVEDNDQSRRAIRDVQSQSQKFQVAPGSYWAPYLPLRKIKEDPLFMPKRADSMLTVADFVAYVLKRRLMRDGRFDRLIRTLKPSLIPFYC